MRHTIRKIVLMSAWAALLTGCGVIPYKASTNSPSAPDLVQNQQASFTLREQRIKTVAGQPQDCSPKRHPRVLVMLALSGGGSRAALLSGLSMLALQDVDGSNVLAEVDLISSVSGGSLAAGYYAISGDPTDTRGCGEATSGRVWDRTEVTRLMSKNYILPWMGNWFWPDNILLYWLTTYDRTDMMAQTFADNLFDTNWVGKDLRFADLNPARPNLVINATQGSTGVADDDIESNGFGQPFTFTREDFGRYCSLIDDYEVSRAVMASATFPGVFNFMTLRNHCARQRYVHLFDGGNSDNLGLTSIKRALWPLLDPAGDRQGKRLRDYDHILVILVDAYTDASGVSAKANDPRHWYDYFVDTNFITATDALLAKNRANLISEFDTHELFPYAVNDQRMPATSFMTASESAQRIQQAHAKVILECERFFSWKQPDQVRAICGDTDWTGINKQLGPKLRFVHIGFGDITDGRLRHQLNNIATNFKLDSDVVERSDVQGTGLSNQAAIECAVPLLFGHDQECGGVHYTASAAARKQWQEVGALFAP